MSSTVDIPGGKATLRENREVKQRDRRRLEAAAVLASPAIAKIQAVRGDDEDPRTLDMAQVGLTRDEFDALYELQDATILAYLKDWTLSQPLPKNADDLGDLEGELYDALREVTKQGGADTLAPVDFSPNPDPESPIVDSGALETPSMAAPESVSTEMPPSGGESSVTAASSAA